METHIDILQQFMALNREFDTDVPIEVNEAIEELINENFKLKNRVEELKFALVDENRKRKERKIVCDAVYKLTRELLSFGFKTVSIEDVESVIKQFDEEE